MITLKNVLISKTENSGKEKYFTHLNGAVIIDMFNNNTLRYNANIQRGCEIKVVKGEDGKTTTVEVPIVNLKKVKKMFVDMENGIFHESTIVLNSTDGSGKIKSYIDDNGVSCLDIDGTIDILDGYHRTSALMLLDKEGGNVKPSDFEFPVEITELDTVSAQQKFYQLTLGAKISVSRAEFFNQATATNKVIRSLMARELRDRVEISRNVIPKKSLERVVTFSTLSNALNANINMETLNSVELEILTDYLNHFFSELFVMFGGFYDEKLRLEESKVVVTYDNFMFYGYIALAIHLYNMHLAECKSRDYSTITKEMQVISKIDFRKNADIWSSIVYSKPDKDGEIKYTMANNTGSRKTIATIFVRIFKDKLDLLIEE